MWWWVLLQWILAVLSGCCQNVNETTICYNIMNYSAHRWWKTQQDVHVKNAAMKSIKVTQNMFLGHSGQQWRLVAQWKWITGTGRGGDPCIVPLYRVSEYSRTVYGTFIVCHMFEGFVAFRFMKQITELNRADDICGKRGNLDVHNLSCGLYFKASSTSLTFISHIIKH